MSAEEVLRVYSPEVRALDWEIEEDSKDFLMAVWSDRASTESYTPGFAYLHDEMDSASLRDFMRGDENHMVRYLVVDPADFFLYVDKEVFKAAIAENPAIDEMRKLGVIMFTTIYNDDVPEDIEYQRRASDVRTQMKLPDNASVTEFNFWAVPGTRDEWVRHTNTETLKAYALGLKGRTATIMFVDAGDVKNAYIAGSGENLLLSNAVVDQEAVRVALETFQDSRVLQSMKFELLPRRVRYADDSRLLDFVFAKIIAPRTIP